MGQEKQAAAKGQESLRKATDTLSTMLAQEVKDLNARQRAARRENSTDPGIMKGLTTLWRSLRLRCTVVGGLTYVL